jgi:hypothetical protein
MLHIEFLPQIKVTDLLTSVSVFCAAITLIYTWSKDRDIRAKEYADKIRSAASITLSKVDRCQSLFQSITDLVQPAITEVDALMVETNDTVKCRDLLWKRLHELRSSIMEKFRDEQIEVAYAPLFVYNPYIYDLFEDAMRAAKAAETAAFVILQEKCQTAILHLDAPNASTAVLGNALREICGEHVLQSNDKFRLALSEVRVFLKLILSMTDKQILDAVRYRLGFKGGVQRPNLGNPLYWMNSWETEGRPSKALSSYIARANADTGERARRAALSCRVMFDS